MQLRLPLSILSLNSKPTYATDNKVYLDVKVREIMYLL